MWRGLSSQLDTYIAEVQARDTPSVIAFEFWQAGSPSGIARLAKDLDLCTCFILDDEALHFGLSGWDFVQSSIIRLSESAERNLLSTATVFRRRLSSFGLMLRANVITANALMLMFRNRLAEHNWYCNWQLFSGEKKIKCFVN